MAKYKDADELLKRLNSCKYPAEKTTMRQATYNAAISDACRIVDAIPAVDIPRWIPCSERMPKDRQRVLVQFINGFITLIDFHAEGLTNHIEAWMPLPTPYKGGEEE